MISLISCNEKLKQTNITQPAVFVHSIAAFESVKDSIQYHAAAGHSLGEITALVAVQAINFADGLRLVKARAEAMQYACELQNGTMAAILGLEDEVVEEVCQIIGQEVVAANYNCPGQLVISGSIEGIEAAVEQLKEKGARRALILNVGGAFHSSLMAPAEEKLAEQINETAFSKPTVDIFQNVTASPTSDPEMLKTNLLKQLTAPVRWTQTMLNLIDAGHEEFYEFGGNGKTLSGFLKRISREYKVTAII